MKTDEHGYVRFEEGSKYYCPKASVSALGTIRFNGGVRNRFDFDGFTHAIIYHHPLKNHLAIALTTNEREPGARLLTFTKCGVVIAGKSALEFFNLMPKHTIVCNTYRDEATGRLIIELEGGKVRGSVAPAEIPATLALDLNGGAK